jgi:peptide/nickel transport system substrate-binding protein
MRIGAWLGGLLVACGVAAGPAAAQKSADTLRIVWFDQIPDVDPYYNQLRTGLVVAHQSWDTLVYRDPESFIIKPLLAISWKFTDDTTLEMQLRHGVTFQDGSPFSADDVVYTVNTVLTDKKVSVPSNFSWLAGAEKIDDYAVRLKLKRTFPAALEYLAMVLPIWPKAYRERVGEDAYAQAPIGTGPYRITKVLGASEIDMERYDGYFAGSPKGKPAISRLAIHEVADSNTAMNELLGGKADWTWNFLADNFDNVARMPNLQATRAETMRIQYLQLDAAGRTGPDNPLTKQKVRQAIFYAIDRQSIAKQLVQGGSRVPDGPCFFTQFGCDTSTAMRYKYDPARAKQLLTEAGYPNGFDTEIVTAALPEIGGALQNYLHAVGINARISQLQTATAVSRNLDGTSPMNILSWGSYSVNDVSAILPFFFTGGGNDYARDPTLATLVETGDTSTDPDVRRKSYAAAIKLVMDQAYFLPLNTGVTTYAFSRQLNFKPYPDELPRFYLYSWK